MRATVHLRVTGGQVRRVLPPALAERVPPLVRPEAEYAVVLFRDSVVRSAAVTRALKRLPLDGRALIAAGPDFTLEAGRALEERGAVAVISEGYFGWTDESYRSIRQG